jgi:predicted ATPase
VDRSARSGELLEREAPLDGLRAALADAARGEGRIVLVAGEAGIGKTSVVRAFLADLAGDGGVRVLRGACDHLVTPRELGPFTISPRSLGRPCAPRWPPATCGRSSRRCSTRSRRPSR